MAEILPSVIGHRGACGHAPENTLFSFRKAAALGTCWVEVDAKLTRDGRVILFHDETLERTTNGRGRVRDTDLADIRSLDAGGWFGARFAGERVPTLEDAFGVFAELGLGANIELKPCPGRESETGRRVAERVRADWPRSLPPPLFSSFSAEALTAARAEAPEIERALNVRAIPRDWLRRLTAIGGSALHCHHEQLVPRHTGIVLDCGIALRCYTVNDPERARALYSLGIESVFSDFPDRLVRQQF